MIIIIIGGILIGNIIVSNVDDDDRPLNVAMFDSGLNNNHRFRDDIEIKDYSFAKEKYGYSQDLSATTDGTFHGDAVFNAFMENLRNKDDIIFHNLRVTDNQLESIIEPAALFAAIQFASKTLSIDIAILSLGSTYIYEDIDRFLIQPFIDNDVLVVAAGGNDGAGDNYRGVIATPAVYPDIVAVGAYLDDAVEDYSARGPTPLRTMKPDVIATHNFADELKGTSFTAPAAAAVAADIMLDYYNKNNKLPTIGYTKIALMEGAIPFEDILLSTQGSGRVNLDNSIKFMDLYPNSTETDVFSVFPKNIPITPDFVWDGLRYTFRLTITHASKIKFTETLQLEYLGDDQVTFTEEYYSDFTSLITIVIVPDDEPSGELILTKGSFEESIEINYTSKLPDKIIYYNSLMTDFASSTTRYGTYNLLFQSLANDNIALIDDPFYTNEDNVLLIEPWSLFEESTYNPLLGDISNKHILSLYSIFNEEGDGDFNSRGWNVDSTALFEDFEMVEISYKNTIYTIPYYGWSLKPKAGSSQIGDPIIIASGIHNGAVIGLIDNEWTSLLTNLPFINDAFLGFYGEFDSDFIDLLFEIFEV